MRAQRSSLSSVAAKRAFWPMMIGSSTLFFLTSHYRLATILLFLLFTNKICASNCPVHESLFLTLSTGFPLRRGWWWMMAFFAWQRSASKQIGGVAVWLGGVVMNYDLKWWLCDWYVCFVFYLLRLFTIKVTENQIIAEMLLIICCRGIEFGEKKWGQWGFLLRFLVGWCKKVWFNLFWFSVDWEIF